MNKLVSRRLHLDLGTLFLACIFSSNTFATQVGGFITTDTHWQLSDSPYIAASSVLVNSGAKLTIDPGVEVRFAKATGLVVLDGTLSARGTVDSGITFTADLSGDANRWNGIRFGEDAADAVFDSDANFLSGSILEYATVEAVARHDFGTLRLDDSSPFIHASIIRDNLSKAISAKGADGLRVIGNQIQRNGNSTSGPGGGVGIVDSQSVILSDNEITDNLGFQAGVNLNGSSDAVISGNEFYRNSGSYGGLYLSSAPRGLVSNNIFTDNSSTENGGGIFIQSSSHSVVTGNTLERNTASRDGGGMYFCCSTDSTISKNVFRDNNSGNNSSVYLSVNNGIFSENLISGSSGIGLEIRDVTAATLNGNRVIENGGDGIRILRSRDLTIIGSEISENTGDGIQINGTNVGSIVVSDDETNPTIIAGNDGHQIYSDLLFEGSTDPLARGNVDARNVWWGTTEIPTIEAGIFDFFDNSNYGIVFYDPSAPSPGIDGDFNRDGEVDAADYTVWRDGLGTFFTEDDYDLWRSSFGIGYGSSGKGSLSTVPEPEFATLLFISCVLLAIRRSLHAT